MKEGGIEGKRRFGGDEEVISLSVSGVGVGI